MPLLRGRLSSAVVERVGVHLPDSSLGGTIGAVVNGPKGFLDQGYPPRCDAQRADIDLQQPWQMGCAPHLLAAQDERLVRLRFAACTTRAMMRCTARMRLARETFQVPTHDKIARK